MNGCLIKFKEYFLALLFVFLLYIFIGKAYATGSDYACEQGVAASVAFLNQSTDIVADKGVMATVSSVASNRISNILKLDTYGKYFFTRKFSKNVYLNDVTFFRFSDIDSKLGTRISFIFSEHATAYCGGAWEYATTGTIDIKKSADSFPTLKEGSGIGEVSASENFKDFSFVFSRIKRFLGYSTEKFYSKKTKRFSKNFKMSKKDCFGKTLEIIKKLETRVTHKSFDKGYIIAFNFAKSFEDCCLDSTEVGIFITEKSSENIIVEVCSGNNILGGKFSVKFFEMLIEKPDDSSKEDDNKSNA
jgi:hypothetical protein